MEDRERTSVTQLWIILTVHVCGMKECVINTSYVPVVRAWTHHEVFKGKGGDDIHSQTLVDMYIRMLTWSTGYTYI